MRRLRQFTARFVVARATGAPTLARAAATCVVLAALAARSAAADSPAATLPLYQLLLTNGQALTSYGEYARVGDRVVFTTPIGDVRGQPRLHMASVPAALVDWVATERSRDAVRAARYADTRGEADYTALGAELTRLLDGIVGAPDDGRRLALAEETRRLLAEWPAAHYGYRADDVREMLLLVDEVIAGLRAARGEQRFSVDLTASTVPAPAPPRVRLPTLQESVGQALFLSTVAATPADRVSLLESVHDLLVANTPTLPRDWAKVRRAQVAHAIEDEQRVERKYAELRADALETAARLARRGDVKGLARLEARVLERDRKLGARRPDAVAALVATLSERLKATRTAVDARARASGQAAALAGYRKAVARPLDALEDARPQLEAIRRAAGPDDRSLARLDARLSDVSGRLARVDVAPAAQAIHRTLASAVHLAASAAHLRRTATRTGDLRQAWDASAASAGALLLLDRARADLGLLPPPGTRR